MDTDRIVLMMNTFVMSQFSYRPLIWMFHRRINNKVNKIHERALRVAYKDSHSCFESLLKRNNSVSLHQRNLQLLWVEIFKTKENLNPSFMKDIFIERTENYNLKKWGYSAVAKSIKSENDNIRNRICIISRLTALACIARKFEKIRKSCSVQKKIKELERTGL